MLSDSESTKYTTLRGGGGILNPDSNKFARVGGKHSTAVGVSKLLDSILHLRYQEQVCCSGGWSSAESCSECLAAQDSPKIHRPIEDWTLGRIPMRNAIAAGTFYRVTF